MDPSTLKIVTFNVNGLNSKNKRDRVLAYLNNLNADIILLQETKIINETTLNKIKLEWKGQSFWDLGSRNARGTAILIKETDKIQVIDHFIGNTGRLSKITCKTDTLKLNIINVYCPKNSTERAHFIPSIKDHLSDDCPTIIGGDFNFIEDTHLDQSGNYRQKSKNAIKAMDMVKSAGCLMDPFRHKHPTKFAFTRMGPNQPQTRLDRFYISTSLLDKRVQIFHEPPILSDHGAVVLELPNALPSKGPGYWKCNTSVLQDPHLKDDIEALWENSHKAIKTPDQWDLFKAKIKSIIINHSCRIAKIKRDRMKLLKSELSYRLSFPSDDPETENALVQQLQAQIQAILSEKIEGQRIRAKITNVYETDKPTVAFLHREKARARRKEINELIVDNRTITAPDQIIKIVRSHFHKLLTENPIDESQWDDLTAGLKSLDEIDKTLCEEPLTFNECWKAVKQMQNGKSPGLDGLPAEFYKLFFPLFGDFLVKMYNEHPLSPSQSHSLITLLSKDPEKAQTIDNWRPISLLNVDYKIMSKALSNRLQKIINRIVHPDQTCAVTGRTIFDNLHLLRNTFDYCKQRSIPCIALAFDQSKAFDRINHRFLMYVIRKMGFGPFFENSIAKLYTDIYSSVIINACVTEPFPVTRSVRQGCGLSPGLFGLCIETLANRVRQNLIIRGIPTPDPNCSDVRVSLYADDTTILVQDGRSAVEVIKVFRQYSEATGAQLNLEKSRACIMAGNPDLSAWPPELKFEDQLKILGIHFGTEAQTLNEDKLRKGTSAAISAVQHRHLTMLGRTTIANIIILAKFWYIAQINDISKPTMNNIRKQISKFIWNNKNPSLPMSTVTLPRKDGGLGLIDPNLKITAFRIRHGINHILNPELRWGKMCAYWCALPLRKFDVRWTNNGPHSMDPNPFYSRVIGHLTAISPFISKDEFPDINTRKIYKLLQVQNYIAPNVLTKRPAPPCEITWRVITEAPLSSTARDLAYKISHRIIYVNARNHILFPNADPKCTLCEQEKETVEHLFINCNIIRTARNFMDEATGLALAKKNQGVHLNFVHSNENERNYRAILITEYLLVIWQKRCKKSLESIRVTPQSVLSSLKAALKSRILADHAHLDIDSFRELWCSRPLPVTLTSSQLHIGF